MRRHPILKPLFCAVVLLCIRSASGVGVDDYMLNFVWPDPDRPAALPSKIVMRLVLDSPTFRFVVFYRAPRGLLIPPSECLAFPISIEVVGETSKPDRIDSNDRTAPPEWDVRVANGRENLFITVDLAPFEVGLTKITPNGTVRLRVLMPIYQLSHDQTALAIAETLKSSTLSVTMANGKIEKVDDGRFLDNQPMRGIKKTGELKKPLPLFLPSLHK